MAMRRVMIQRDGGSVLGAFRGRSAEGEGRGTVLAPMEQVGVGEIVVRDQRQGLVGELVDSYVKTAGRVMGGAIANAVVSGILRVPMGHGGEAEHFFENRPEGRRERLGWMLEDGRIVRKVIWGGKKGEEARNDRFVHNRLVAGYEKTLAEAERKIGSADLLVNEAEKVLGVEGVNKMRKLFDAGQIRSGPIADIERIQAGLCRASVGDRREMVTWVDETLLDLFVTEFSALGVRVIKKQLYDRLDSLVRKPIDTLKSDSLLADGEGSRQEGRGWWRRRRKQRPGPLDRGEVDVFVLKPIDKIIAVALGVRNAHGSSLIGSSRVVVDKNGKVWLKDGVEPHLIAPRLGDLGIEADIAQPWQDTSAVVQRVIDFPFAGFFKAIAVGLKGNQDDIYDPALATLFGAGREEEWPIPVLSASGLQRAVGRLLEVSHKGVEMMVRIESEMPSVKHPREVFLKNELVAAEDRVLQLPRRRAILTELGLVESTGGVDSNFDVRPIRSGKVEAGRVVEILRQRGVPNIFDDKAKRYFRTSPDAEANFYNSNLVSGLSEDEKRAVFEELKRRAI